MYESKLVFRKPEKARKHGKSNIVRLTDEAYELLTKWEAATGHSLTYLASAMIIFADDHAVLEEESQTEELNG